MQQQNADEAEESLKFDFDVRMYKERNDDYFIIGNKMQYRASE